MKSYLTGIFYFPRNKLYYDLEKLYQKSRAMEWGYNILGFVHKLFLQMTVGEIF